MSDAEREALNEVLDALEAMVFQYLYAPDADRAGRDFLHAFMSAGEEACETLVRYRPQRWEAQPWGISLRDGES